jgi:alcohol dehydrogenase (cytochrome c)
MMTAGVAAGEPAQEARGADVYQQHCAACHGADLKGRSALDLAGSGSVIRWTGLSAADLYQRVRTMPYGSPDSLSRQDYGDVTAFIIARNGIALPAPLTGEPEALRAIALGQAGLMGPDQTKARITTRHDITAKLAGGPTQAELTAARDSREWVATTHDYAGRRFSPLMQIDHENVGRLRPACLYQVGDMNPFPTNPLAYRGALFLTSRNAVVSIDATTCRLNWRYDRPSRVSPAYGLKMNRGAALKDGKLVFGTHDGFLIALDAGTGKPLWERDVVDARANQGGFNAAPVIFEDLVIIGPAGSEYGVKGWVGAFRLDSGAPVWRFNTVPDDGEPGAETWPDSASRSHGGGAVWGPMTLDPAAGLLYVPVSNPTPDFDGDRRRGANLYTDSLVVLEARSGRLAWYHQVTPHDIHDYDLTQAGPLFTTRIGGRDRHLMAVAGKEGLLRVLDRDTHRPLYDTPVTTRANLHLPWLEAAPGKTASGEKVCPGAVGGVLWNGPAYSPATDMLYVPAVDWCDVLGEPVEAARGWLTAVRAGSGAVAWRYASPRPLVAAVTATAAGLVFTGELTGDLVALDAETGRELWRFNTGGPMSGGIATYEVDGRQYVAAVSGAVGGVWQADPGSATVVVLALPLP